MKIEQDTKLDFSNVLIKPRYTTLNSRKEVELETSYQFKHSGIVWRGVPIMAANMDGVGTVDMALALQEHQLFTCLTKDITDIPYELIPYKYAVSTGISDADFNRLNSILLKYPFINFVCIDVANGYSQRFLDYITKVRTTFSHVTIIAGNVVTPEMAQMVINAGADIVKIGIGPGCFAPGQKVKTDKGLKNIEDIKQGEKVLTHTGSYKTVTNIFKFNDKKSIVKINGIKATPNHEFYVLHKKHRDIVTDENIHQHAEWIEAKNLTKDYLLLKHK